MRGVLSAGGSPCASQPCLNNGSCQNSIRGYTCTCAPGYEGPNCAFGEPHPSPGAPPLPRDTPTPPLPGIPAPPPTPAPPLGSPPLPQGPSSLGRGCQTVLSFITWCPLNVAGWGGGEWGSKQPETPPCRSELRSDVTEPAPPASLRAQPGAGRTPQVQRTEQGFQLHPTCVPSPSRPPPRRSPLRCPAAVAGSEPTEGPGGSS